MTNLFESFLMGILPQLQQEGPSATINITSSPSGRMVSTSSMASGMLPGTERQGNIFTARTDSSGLERSGSLGQVYSGGIPPTLWIQREQQRIPLQFSATSENVAVDDARLREQGNKAFSEGRYTDALDFYTRAIDANPNHELNYTNRSFTHYKLGNFAASLKDANDAIRLKPDFYKAYYRLGLAQIGLGEYQCALESLRKSLSLASLENKEIIRVAIAKCESKLARAPITSLITSCADVNSPNSSVSSKIQTGDFQYPVPVSRPDYRQLQERITQALENRALFDEYETMFKGQTDIVECRDRSQKVKNLMNIATTHKLSELQQHANETQEELRVALKKQQCGAYYNAKRSRDEAFANVWETAAEVERAIVKLREISSEEQAFFRRFGSSSDTPRDHSKTDENVSPALSPTSPSAETLDNNKSSSNDLSQFEQLLRRRQDIDDCLRKAQQYFTATDVLGCAFKRAVEEEEAHLKSLIPLVEEAKGLNQNLERYARRVAQTAKKEISDIRLDALEQVFQKVQRIRSDETSFRETLIEGDRLLEEEAQQERERLVLERQRIQIQAEIDWLKVQDEPETRIIILQNHIKILQQRIADSHAKQKEVQKRILELVQTDHPELAWKSMASGSRILRLIKGSGLWMNMSFSDFQIVSTLSSTVNSKVYHAVRRGEHVALKEVPIDDENARRCFQREINIVASCSHPNIVRIKGVFFDGPFAYILLPYCHRGSLKALLAKKEPISWVTIQDLFRQLATGIAYLHEHGIVHRDIKPSNILIADDGRPQIADFGIAKDSGRLGEDLDLTMTLTARGTSSAKGTANYMAPELLLDEKHSETCKSDIWALGITFFEVAATNAFFHDASLGEPTLVVNTNNNGVADVSARSVGGNEKLADLIDSALTTDVNRRATAYELLAHPYFSSSLTSNNNQTIATLAKSDERIDAVRSYIHALRTSHPQKILVSVVRNRMVESLSNIFEHLDQNEVMGPIMVVFQGEAGIDEGALTTEMLNLYYEQLVNDCKALVCSQSEEDMGRAPSTATSGLFRGVTYIPAADEMNLPTSMFELLGKVLLKNIIENRPLPLQLNSSVLKYFCDAPVSILDLEEYDRILAESLKRLRLLSSEDMQTASITFAHFTATFLSNQYDGKYTRETAVTTDNIRDYVELRVQFDLIEKRKRALDAMKRGFYNFRPIEPHLKLLSPSDLLLLLCGVQHVSAQSIIDALEFQGFDNSSHTPKYLKELLKSMSQNNLRRFLQLCTSTAAMPANGAMKKIKVLRGGDTRRLPVGHGCVYQIDLPDYNDKNVLQEKLEVALAHVSDGFHVV